MFAIKPVSLLSLTLAVLTCAGFSAPAQAKGSKLKLTPTSQRVEVGERARFRVVGAKKRCKVTYSEGRALVSGPVSRQSWSFMYQSETEITFRVRCGSRQATARLQVYEPSSSAPANPPGNNPAPPTNPVSPPRSQLTGSDAEAEAWWSSRASFYNILSRGDCVAYAWSRRPDIPERVEKTAYKQWVKDGAPLTGGGSANDLTNPSWQYFAGAAVNPSMNYPSWLWDDLEGTRGAWTTWAAKAGFTVDRTPNVGDLAVSNGHVAVVQEVRQGDQMYVQRQMSSSRPGVVFDTTESSLTSSIINRGVYFVG